MFRFCISVRSVSLFARASSKSALKFAFQLLSENKAILVTGCGCRGYHIFSTIGV
jgi:hypothetical protein